PVLGVAAARHHPRGAAAGRWRRAVQVPRLGGRPWADAGRAAGAVAAEPGVRRPGGGHLLRDAAAAHAAAGGLRAAARQLVRTEGGGGAGTLRSCKGRRGSGPRSRGRPAGWIHRALAVLALARLTTDLLQPVRGSGAAGTGGRDRSRRMLYPGLVHLRQHGRRPCGCGCGPPAGDPRRTGGRNHPPSARYSILSPAQALADSSLSIAASSSRSPAALVRSSSCSSEVALAIRAVTPGRAIKQASATCAAWTTWSTAPARCAGRTRVPRSANRPSSMPARAAPCRSSTDPYLPVRRPLASEK